MMMESSEHEIDEVCGDWVRLLTLVLGWDVAAAGEWAERTWREMAGSKWFLHETVSWYVVPLIVTNEAWHRARRPGEMGSRVDLALERFRVRARQGVSLEEVEAVRSEVAGILEQCE